MGVVVCQMGCVWQMCKLGCGVQEGVVGACVAVPALQRGMRRQPKKK